MVEKIDKKKRVLKVCLKNSIGLWVEDFKNTLRGKVYILYILKAAMLRGRVYAFLALTGFTEDVRSFAMSEIKSPNTPMFVSAFELCRKFSQNATITTALYV